jgi:hypothetical protein
MHHLRAAKKPSYPLGVIRAIPIKHFDGSLQLREKVRCTENTANASSAKSIQDLKIPEDRSLSSTTQNLSLPAKVIHFRLQSGEVGLTHIGAGYGLLNLC